MENKIFDLIRYWNQYTLESIKQFFELYKNSKWYMKEYWEEWVIWERFITIWINWKASKNQYSKITLVLSEIYKWVEMYECIFTK